MLGFSPLASATLADDGVVVEQAYGLDAITTGAPTVDASSITQVHNITPSDITAGAPVIDASSITGNHLLSSIDVTSSSPIVDTPTCSEVHELTASEVTASVPTIDAPNLDTSYGLNSVGITLGSPSIDTVIISQIHQLTGSEITSGIPVVDNSFLPVSFSAPDITTSAPTVDTSSISQDHIFREFIGSFRVKVIDGKFHLADASAFQIYGDFFETPDLELHGGYTLFSDQYIVYNFWVGDSSMAGYEFRFRDIDGNPYTDGVTIYSPNNDPETKVELRLGPTHPEYLEYYCLNHSDVGGRIFIRTSSNRDEMLANTQIITDAPVIDDVDYFIALSADNLSSAPTIDQPGLSQVHDLNADEVTASNVVIDAADYFIQLTANEITAGSALIDTPVLKENDGLFSVSITLGSPIVDQSRILGFAALSRVDIDGANEIIVSDSNTSVIVSDSRSSVIIQESMILANVA